MLFAFDLDGTIVTHGKEMPTAIRDTILALRAAGHVVTVITGRHLSSTQHVLDSLSVDCHYGTCNGARVHAHGDEHHAEFFLDTDVVSHLLERFTRSADAQFFLSTRDRMYVPDPGHAHWEWARAEGRDLHHPHAYQGEGAHKFIVVSEHVARLHSELSERFPGNRYYLWNNRYLEIVAPGGDKGNALARIAEEYGIAQADTIAFGDGVNDLEMLSWAGRAIGVGRLSPGVADVIDEHIPAPEELGVARWLEQHVLGEPLRARR